MLILSQERLFDSELSLAMLYQAVFFQAKLSQAMLSQAMLSQAMLSHAMLSQVVLVQGSVNQVNSVQFVPRYVARFQANGWPYRLAYSVRAASSATRSPAFADPRGRLLAAA